MAYRRPSIEVIEEFQNAAATLALPTLPACVIGPGYQISDGVNAGVYDGTSVEYSYLGLADGGIVDLSAAPATTAELNVWKGVSISIKDAYLIRLSGAAGAVLSTGKIDVSGQGKSVFTDPTASQFAGFDPAAAGAPKFYLEVVGPVQAKAIGTIVAVAKAQLVDGETFTLDDGVNPPTVFEFDVTGNGATPGNTAVNVSTDTTALDVANRILTAINGVVATLAITATSVTSATNTVNLQNDAYGAYNTAISDTVADVGFTHTGMTGGVVGIDAADAGKKLITVKTNDNTITVATEFQTATVVADVTYRILEYRSVEVIPDTSYAALGITVAATGVTLPAFPSLTAPSDSRIIETGTVLLGWRALRPDLANAVTAFTDVDSLKAVFGTTGVVPTNIGAYAVSLALQNTTTAVSFTGLDDTFFSDEELSWQSALEFLESKDVYGLAILTYNTAVHQNAKSHVEAMSDSTVGRERVCFINRQLLTYAVVTPASGLGTATGGALTSTPATTYRTFRDSDATFITDGVNVGHFLEITDVTVGGGVLTAAQLSYIKTTRHKIAKVDSENQIELVNDPTNGGTGGLTLDSITYRITRDFTRDEEASFIAGYSSSFASRRVVHTWPDVLAVSVNSVATQVPGFFAGAVLAGMTAGLPSQAGFTNLSIVGFVGRANSDDRYTDAQLDVIAGGGTLVLTQPVAGAALGVRHQLTTDVSTIYFQEFSVTKNVDMIARFFRQLYANLLGIYNITDTLLDLMKTRGEGAIQFLLSQRVQRVGAPIRRGSITRIEESAIQPDSVEVDVDVDVPLPLNHVTVTLLV